jgi:hypothetical protein
VPEGITGPLFPSDINTETALQVRGVPNESKIWSSVLRDLNPRVTALSRPRNNCASNLQTHPLVKEGARHQQIQTKEKSGHKF